MTFVFLPGRIIDGRRSATGVKGLAGIDCELISVNDDRVNCDQYWFSNKWTTVHRRLLC